MTKVTDEKNDSATLPTPSKMSEAPNKNFVSDIPGVKEIDLPESGSKVQKPNNEMNKHSEENVEVDTEEDFKQKLPSDDHSADQY